MIVLIDNYDSFAHNLARYLRRLGGEVQVVRNDQLTVEELKRWKPKALVLSPGPGTPQQAGICIEAIRQMHKSVPILGVCLGHQAIVAAWGGEIGRAAEPCHGRASSIVHRGHGLFQHVPSPFRVGRYHSLVAIPESLPKELTANAWSEEGVIMAVQHHRSLTFGLQFHPESVLTEWGYTLLANFLRHAGMEVQAVNPATEMQAEVTLPRPHLGMRPVSF